MPIYKQLLARIHSSPSKLHRIGLILNKSVTALPRDDPSDSSPGTINQKHITKARSCIVELDSETWTIEHWSSNETCIFMSSTKIPCLSDISRIRGITPRNRGKTIPVLLPRFTSLLPNTSRTMSFEFSISSCFSSSGS